MITNKNAKQIMVYGDSYVFGKIPGDNRYDSETRFTGIIQKELGETFEIIEEGLRGRMLAGENKFFPYRNGLVQFDGIIGSHLPLDLLILFLGTNDCNSGSELSAEEVIHTYDQYLEKAKWWAEQFGFPLPKIMIIAPPVVNEAESYNMFKDIFKGSQEKSRKLPGLLEEYAKAHNLLFFDASKIITVSPIDGIHLDVEANKVLGKKLAEEIRNTA